MLNLRIIVQSDRTPMYVDTRIENYIDTIQVSPFDLNYYILGKICI